MTEQRKQERDFTPEVDALLAEVDTLVKVLVLEFEARVVADVFP
jgi:26S proteasome regulatory subunit N5